MRPVKCSHSNLVTLISRFRCLPVLNELTTCSVISKRGSTGSRHLERSFDRRGRVTRNHRVLEALDIAYVLSFCRWASWSSVDVELQRYRRATLHRVKDED